VVVDPDPSQESANPTKPAGYPLSKSAITKYPGAAIVEAGLELSAATGVDKKLNTDTVIRMPTSSNPHIIENRFRDMILLL